MCQCIRHNNHCNVTVIKLKSKVSLITIGHIRVQRFSRDKARRLRKSLEDYIKYQINKTRSLPRTLLSDLNLGRKILKDQWKTSYSKQIWIESLYCNLRVSTNLCLMVQFLSILPRSKAQVCWFSWTLQNPRNDKVKNEAICTSSYNRGSSFFDKKG